MKKRKKASGDSPRAFTNVTCLTCGWVHMSVSREHAEKSVKQFQDYYDSLSKKEQNDYYGGSYSGIKGYEHCFFCNGHYTHFRTALPGDCPDGCTIQGIIHFGELPSG